mgnify:FL=1
MCESLRVTYKHTLTILGYLPLCCTLSFLCRPTAQIPSPLLVDQSYTEALNGDVIFPFCVIKIAAPHYNTNNS